MDKLSLLRLDNRTITKLAMAIAYATDLKNNFEVVGPATRKVLEYLDEIDGLAHFKDYREGQTVV